MVGLNSIREFAAWVLEAYGAVSSILIFVIIYLIWQLRCEQKEAREVRLELSANQQRMVEQQLQVVQAMHELKNSIAVALAKIGNRR
jgi:membrane carboxypeptidase/penicillin-binding protein PbpC